MSALFRIAMALGMIHAQNPCEYRCRNKGERPWNKKGHTFSSNGCGSMGITVSLDSRIEHCCDTHDACYSGMSVD